MLKYATEQQEKLLKQRKLLEVFEMLILILIIVIVILYWLVKGGLSIFGGAAKGIHNLIDPQTTDESTGPLIAGAAQNLIDYEYPGNEIAVVEFQPKTKSITTVVTNPEDIELIKQVKDLSQFEITTVNQYRKTYWDGTLILEYNGQQESLDTRAAVYTDDEGRGGFATCYGNLDLDCIKEFISKTQTKEDATPVFTRDMLEQQTKKIVGIWKLTGIKEKGSERTEPIQREYDICYLEISEDNYLHRYSNQGIPKERARWKADDNGCMLYNGNRLYISGKHLMEYDTETGKEYEYTCTEKIPTLEDINPRSAQRWKIAKTIYHIIMALFVLLAILAAMGKL